MNDAYVKVFTEEREMTVMLLVDLSASERFGSVGRPKIEAVAEVAALLAFSAIKNNDRVGLVLFTDRIERFVPKKNIRDLVGGDYFSPFREGHTVELLRDPETQEFSTAFVKRVRPDGTVDVEFAEGGEEKRVRPWRLRLVHPGGFDMMPSGTEVEVLCTHPSGGASYERGRVRWLHRDGRYVIQTQDKLNPITRVAELLEGLAKKVRASGEAQRCGVAWARTKRAPQNDTINMSINEP